MACSVTTKYPKTSPCLHPSSNVLDGRCEVFVLTVHYGQKSEEQSLMFLCSSSSVGMFCEFGGRTLAQDISIVIRSSSN